MKRPRVVPAQAVAPLHNGNAGAPSAARKPIGSKPAGQAAAAENVVKADICCHQPHLK